MSGEAIKLEHITKIYKLYGRNRDRLKDSLGLTKKKCYTEHYALRDVSMEVREGEMVGIIGVNGSGKSTILKIITGVLSPSGGTMEINGRISALLELGAGFNMEYTGLENVYLNGTMMGFSEKEIEERLPQILEFADIGEFIHQPVKTYSSGMFVRLAFAVAINIDPEILIVDEALAVGDVFFQAKCYHKFEEFKKMGKTILFVSHDLTSIAKYCDRVILLNKGHYIAEGEPGRMVDLYKKILANQMDLLEEELAEMNDFSGEEAAAGGTDAAGGASQGAGWTSADGADSQGAGRTGAEGSASQGAGRPGAEGPASQGTEGPGKAPAAGLMKDKLSINPNRTEYGNGKAEIYDLGLLDERGNVTNLLLKGEYFEIRERIRFYDEIAAPIFTYTIKDKKGTELSGTNTMFEGAEVKPVGRGDEYEVTFRQKMTLQGGEYLLSMSCTGFEQGEHTVYHRLYDIASITVISNKNTVGVYDMESEVTTVFRKGQGDHEKD